MPDMRVTALFDSPHLAAAGILAARKRGATAVDAAMPAPFPEVIDAIGKPRSKLGWATFAGATFGVSLAFFLTIWMSLDWPLITAGKPIVSLPPYVIVAFENSVIFGAIATVSTLAIGAFRGRARFPATIDTRATGAAIAVIAIGPKPDELADALAASGAKEVLRAP